MKFVWSLRFGFWDFRGVFPAALWLKRDRYHETPFSPWFRTPLVKRGNGRLVERWIACGAQSLDRNGIPICVEQNAETARALSCSTGLPCLRRITWRRCVNQFLPAKRHLGRCWF